MGDGSGRSGDTVRIIGIDGAETLSYQLVVALEGPSPAIPFEKLLFVFSVSLDNSSGGSGVGGKGFPPNFGCGGTFLINDLNDLTGLSIPSSDDELLFDCRNGDDRKWS